MSKNPTKSSTKETTKARELKITRTFDAPIDSVFKAWTDPTQVAKWWGPRGFTNPVTEIEPREGGSVRIDMKGPDGTTYPMTGKFDELVDRKRIVMSGSANDDEGNPQLEDITTVEFHVRDGYTELKMKTKVIKASPEMKDALEGMEEGWSQSLDRLTEHLALQQHICATA